MSHAAKTSNNDGAGSHIQNGLSPKSGSARSGFFMRELGRSTAVKGSTVPFSFLP